MRLPRKFICLVFFALALLITGAPAASSSEGVAKPNIIFFLADDLGPDGVGVYGSYDHEAVVAPPGADPATWTDAWGRAPRPSTTPHIDRLAAEGIRFTHAYATGICSPSRVQYATGQYPFRNGSLDIDGSNYRSDPHKPSLTELLKNAGYVTGKTGKADIDRERPDEDLNGWQFWKEDARPAMKWRVTGPSLVTEPLSDYMPANSLAFTLDFIERQAADPERPFYFILGFHLPHAPIHPTPDSLEFHGGAPEGETETERIRRHYADMLRYMDKSVGAVVERLDALGELDNTILVFAGDNGSLNQDKGARLQSKLWDPHTESYRELDGSKADRSRNRDGSTLVPLIVRWPAAISPGRFGSVSHELVDFSDFLPTYAEIAGVEIPSEWTLDGQSFLPILRGEPHEPREWVYTQLQRIYSLTGQDYRLDWDGRFFDMADAPFAMTEITDLTPEQQAVRERFQAVLDRFDPENGPTYEGHADFRSGNPAWDWKHEHFGRNDAFETPIAGDDSDPDGDGVPNIVERAFGWDPKKGSDTLPQARATSEGVVLEIPVREANDVRVIVEHTPDNGKTWSALEPATDDSPVRFIAPGTDNPDDLRLRAERLTPWPEI